MIYLRMVEQWIYYLIWFIEEKQILHCSKYLGVLQISLSLSILLYVNDVFLPLY